MLYARASFLSFLLSLAAVSSAEDKLSLSPPDTSYVKFVGNSFFVSCTANGRNVQRVMWNGPENKQITDYRSSPVQESERERIHVDAGSTNQPGVDLYFRDLEMRDRGIYTCSANVDGREVDKKFNLTVHWVASFEATPKEQFLEEGKNSTLQCNVVGDPRPVVSWLNKNGTTIKKGRQTKFKAHPDNKDWLIVYNVTLADAGNYTCRSRQLTKDISELKNFKVKVNVNHKPFSKVKQASESYSFLSGVVNLTCEAIAQPEAKFTWLRDGITITDSDIYEIFDESHKSILQVNVEAEQMFGDYNCRAQNKFGTFERVVTLEKGKQPAIPHTEVKQWGEDQLTLEIHSQNQPEMPIVSYKVEYKKPGDDWNRARNQKFKSGKPYILTGLKPDTTYVIRASAQNVAGLSDPSPEIMKRTMKTAASSAMSIVAQIPLTVLTSMIFMFVHPSLN